MMNSAVFKRTSLAMMMALALAACGGGGGGSDNGGGNNGGGGEVTDYALTISSNAGKTADTLICNQGSKSSSEFCGLRMYQIMVEAYVNGDPTIDYDTGYGPSKHKGDLQGIINSLDYIKSTGVNALWLTPVFDSCAGQTADPKLEATGYFACDYFKIDPKFGTNSKFQELVTKAHEKGLYVFLDGVFGHASTKLKPLANLPASLAGLSAPKTAASVANAYNTCTASTTQACFDYSDSATLEYFKAVAAYYVSQYGIDGWRLDQAYQVPATAWAEIRASVEQASADRAANGEKWGTLGYMVAEVWDGNQSKVSSLAYGSASKPALKSAFNFPLYYGMLQAIGAENGGASTSKDATSLFASWNDGSVYPAFATPNLFLGNHDVPRFGDLLQRANMGNPTDSSTGEYWLRHKAAFSFMTATSGPITFYYGEEIGDQLDGFSTAVTTNCADLGRCDDHVSRTDGKVPGVTAGYTATAQQTDLKTYLAALLKLRDDHPALAYGSLTRIYQATPDAQVFIARKDATSDNVLYLLNTKKTDAVVTLSTAALGATGELVNLLDSSNTIAASGGNYVIKVPALTGSFYQIN